jgi:hypothetical protein
MVFSQRIATRLKRFNLPMSCSIRARVRYRVMGKCFGLALAFDRYGMIGTVPCWRAAARFVSASYPLSVITPRGTMSGPIPSRTLNCRLSLAWLAVR